MDERSNNPVTPEEIRQRREERASVWNQMQDIEAGADGRQMNQEEINRWDALEARLTALTSEIETAEANVSGHERVRARSSELRSTLGRPGAPAIDTSTVNAGDSGDEGERRYAEAFGRLLRYGAGGLSAEDRATVQSRFGAIEGRAAGTGTTAGGYFVPQGFRQKIVETMKAFGGVRQVAEVITTDTGATLPWPTNDDTANVGAILSENTQVTEQDVLLGQANLDAYMYTSKLIRVSLQLLQDSAFDLEAWLARKLGERIGRIQNQHFTTGTGTAQPDGIQTNAVIGKTGATGQTTSVAYDDLVDLMFSLDEAYQDNARWMLRNATLAAVRKIKDTTNRPLWEPSLQANTPDTLLGKPVVRNPDMPAMAANAKSILYGDFNAGYVIRDVLGIQQLRLEERYADFLQVGFLAFARADGTVQDASAYRAYANSAT
jgi:HK97 family phage major capsid protein